MHKLVHMFRVKKVNIFADLKDNIRNAIHFYLVSLTMVVWKYLCVNY